MEVVGVRVEMPSNQPIVLLKEIDGSRFLPIWVGAVEATAIAFAQQGVEPPRPLTHDLMNNLLDLLDATVTAVHLTEIKDGIFTPPCFCVIQRLANSLFQPGLQMPSHWRCAVTAIFWPRKSLLDEIGIEIPQGDGENQEVEKFREFLDQINPEDFVG